jgi:arylsulfatase A-like enzyme
MLRFVLPLLLTIAALHAADRPNILLLTCEDSSPHLGCYGDKNANTPNLDALAARGLRYTRAWSNAPVCAPARTCLISGRWAPADGAEHMRSEVPMPNGHQMYPQMLRAAGYYCTNNRKEDYNLTKPEGVWDDSSAKAHWKNRPDGKPFFAIFNDETTHESKIRARPHTLIHDPAKVVIPAYMPDTPEIRHDWAQHFDNVTTMDGHVGEKLKELAEAGLAEDTIVIFFSDHGTGIARSKRWPYNSGLQVPFIVHFPEKWKHLAPKDYKAGGTSDRLISFIDLAPTLLSLVGVQPPDYLHGRAFAGQHIAEPRQFAYGFRSRMDERIDITRSVTDGRYVYIRNFMPHLPQGQFLAYMFEQASTRSWFEQFTTNKTLNADQDAFWKPKQTEELYDLQKDPYETQNLAYGPKHDFERQRLSFALGQWLVETRDLSVVPEALRLSTAAGASPKDAFASEQALPYGDTLSAALTSSDRLLADPNYINKQLSDPQASIRYWAVTGYVLRGKSAVEADEAKLLPLLKDPVASVRIAAAYALADQGSEAAQKQAWPVLLTSANASQGSSIEATEALNVISHLGDKALPYKEQIAKLPITGPDSDPARVREYPSRLLAHLGSKLGFTPAKAAGEGKAKAGGKKKNKKQAAP